MVPCYPFDAEVASRGAKVVTRTGRTVIGVKVDTATQSERVVTGLLDGKRQWWDMAGRFLSPYEDSENDLYIPDRYFSDGWQDVRYMSYAEWRDWYKSRKGDKDA